MRDKALAIQAYAHRAKNYDAERHAAEIRVRAERRCGELLRETPKNKGTRMDGKDAIGGSIMLPPSATQTLADLRITKRESSAWQKLAEVPEGGLGFRLDWPKIASGCPTANRWSPEGREGFKTHMKLTVGTVGTFVGTMKEKQG